jgi:hypothetical protein
MSTTSHNGRVNRGALWFGLLGGAFAWLAHLIFAYLVAEFGCVGRWDEQSYLGVSVVAWLVIALTAATTLAACAATAVAYRSHRLLRSSADHHSANPAAERDTAWYGVLTSGLFVFVILFESIPILYYLKSC